MFTRRISLFSLFGFEVFMDLTWLILAVLVTWSLAVGLFPALYPELGASVYWWMGIAGTIGLFLSIVVHELSHSLVARLYGMPISGITLFIFGGVAEMSEEPGSPKAEFFTAIVGPITSLALAALFYVLAGVAAGLGGPLALTGVIAYLAMINLLLAVFNMAPAFPLDGGRVLRAALWGWKGSYRWATRVAAAWGSGFGILLIVLGVVSVVTGNFIGGMWWFLIGLFVRGAAQASYQQAIVRETLQGVPVRRFMTAEPVTVEPGITIEELIERYFYEHYFKSFPVVEGERLLGCVNLREVKQAPRQSWHDARVRDVMRPRSAENTVGPHLDAAEALKIMMRTSNARLMVAEGARLLGIVSQSDILRFLAVRLDLEAADGGTAGGGTADDTLAETRERLAQRSG